MSGRVTLKIYGERNTGTNYLTKLAEQNLEAEILPGRVEGTDLRTTITRRLRRLLPTLADSLHEAARDRYFEATFARNLGWKHMNPAVDRISAEALASVRFLMLVKNPYSWLLSLFQRPYHVGARDVRFEDFLKRRLPVMELRENIGPDLLPPVEVWNRKMHGYLALQAAAAHSCIVQYEDFLVDESATLTRVAEELGIPVRRDFIHIDQGVKDADHSTLQSEYAEYYLEKRWLSKLSVGAVKQINALLDADLVTRMGYAIIDPETLGKEPE